MELYGVPRSYDHLTIIQVRENFQRVTMRQPPKILLELEFENFGYFTSPFGPKMDRGETEQI